MGIGIETGRANNWGAGPHVVLPVMESFQAARLDFAMEIAKLGVPPDSAGVNVPGGSYETQATEKVLASLEASTTLADDLIPLVDDLAPSVRQCAMIALGRLCTLSLGSARRTN